ncbi:hypothetical protein KHA80_15465 [Anaerobacillus sp. HL2]|nr:hypothetical protein KHA80_15465 [Anaerobacillus sp. HL2]
MTGEHNRKGEKAQFPIVVTTYRLTEHCWQTGVDCNLNGYQSSRAYVR